MMYLDKIIQVWNCPECGQLEDPLTNDDNYEHYCPECNRTVTRCHNREAKWWSVGVYDKDRVYGGPEEGGWYYSAGDLTYKWEVRGFEDMDEARRYADQLREKYFEDKRIIVICFTEELPIPHYPTTRPHYS